MSRLFPTLTACALLGACAGTGYHASQLNGTRYHTAAIDTYPVIVSKIDGRSTPIGGPALTEPGEHTVLVQTVPDRVHRFGLERSVQLRIEPCTRYYLVAVKSTPLANEFSVKVDHQEPIAGCTPSTAG